MFFRILKKDLKRKKVMNAVLLSFILLAAMFVASGLSNVVSVMNGTDHYLKKAGIAGLKVPHIGWNSLQFEKDEPLFCYNKPGDYVYYVHSFYGTDCEESIIATSEYGVTITGAVRSGKVYGTQFHPEKSGEAGLKMLKAFMEV